MTTIEQEALERTGMTLGELEQLVRRARTLELPDDARVFCPSYRIRDNAVRRLEIKEHASRQATAR